MSHPTEVEIRAERSAKRFYIGLVLLLFAIQATILGIALSMVIGEPALAVIPDYHQAALDWDNSRAASTAAHKKGWELQLEVSDIADGRGMRALQFHALDQNHQPISDLVILAKVYHHAQADLVERFELRHVGEGRYMAMPKMGRPGLWQIEMDVQNAGTPMTFTETVEFQG